MNLERAARQHPFPDWLPHLHSQWLRSDVIAGITTAAVVIPKAMGYATVAGLPVQVGLYTCFVPMLAYALLGTSRTLSVSTSTTLGILTAAQLGQVAAGADQGALLQATALLTLMVGAALMLAALLRLGFVANFISEPVLVGFKAGIAVVIIVDQSTKILGIHFPKGSLLHNLQGIALNLAHVSMPTLALGMAAIAGLVALRKFMPHGPAPLIVVAVAIAAVAWLGLDRYGIELVGVIPAGLPALSMPDWRLAGALWPGALGIALMSFTETAAAGRAFARADEPPLRPNAELFATGVANAAGALVGAMPAGGGTSQTAVNVSSGARTQLAELVTALVALLAMLFLAPLIGLMPQAVLASIVIVYSVGLIKPADFRHILEFRRTEFIWALAALLGVMLLGTLQGILVAIIVSVIGLGYQTSNPPVYVLGRKRGTNVFRPRSARHPQDEFFPGLLLLRVDGRLFFLNAERLAEKMRPLIAEAHPKVVAIYLSGVFDLEYTALRMLTEGEKRQREGGVEVWLVGLNPGVLRIVRRSRLGATLGTQRLLPNLEVAVRNFQALQQRPATTAADARQDGVQHG
jgi:high affinity sulfate transporter 1